MAIDYGTEIEDAIDAFKALILDHAGAYLSGIASDKGDGVTLEDFRSVEITTIDPYTQSMVPACLLFPETGSIDELSAGSDQLTVRIIAVVVVGKGSPTMLAKRLTRYVEALRQLVRDNVDIGGAVGSCRMTGFEVYPAPDRVTVGLATIDVEIIKEIPRG